MFSEQDRGEPGNPDLQLGLQIAVARTFDVGDNEILAPHEAAATSSLAGRSLRVGAVVATTVAAVLVSAALTIYTRPQPRQLETGLDVTTDDSYRFGSTSSYAEPSLVFRAALAV